MNYEPIRFFNESQCGFGHISPVSDTAKNLRNLQCLAVECEQWLPPGGIMEKKSAADSQVGGGGLQEIHGGDYYTFFGKPQMAFINLHFLSR